MVRRATVIGLLTLWPFVATETTKAGSLDADYLEGSEQICRRFGAIQPPAEDQPDERTRASLKGCDDEGLYYGIGRPADPVAARQCAFANIGNGPFSGESLLITIYANGVGVPRRLDVAIGLACKYSSGRRVEHLYHLLRTDWQGADYSWCTDVMDTIDQTFCAHHKARVATARQEEVLASMASRWGSGVTADRFAKLREAHSHFVGVRGENEVDQTGTLRSALVVYEEEVLSEQFVEDLEGFVQGTPPCLGAEKSIDADARMNAIYRKIQRMPPAQYKDGHGTIEQGGIKTTQRAWLKFRDAWVAFVGAAYPNVPREAVINWLTLRRITQLEEMAD